jgi:peptidoglycan-associated lipoprotein
VNEVETSARRLIYEVTLSEDEGDFTFGDATLPSEAKARLDQMVTQLKADPKGVFIEVEGHTDNVGPAAYNQQLGLERAETVKRYLYAQHQVPTAQDQRDQLRRGQAGRAQHHADRPGAEPPRRRPNPVVDRIPARS